MELKKLSIFELEELLEFYPWFVVVRKELFLRKGNAGDEALQRAVAAAGIHLLSRAYFLKSVKESVKERFNEDLIIGKPSQAEHRLKYYVVGGDYFSQDDFKELELSGEAFKETFKINPISSTLSSLPDFDFEKRDSTEDDSDQFCTETLARIYVEQEFYNQALSIYEKLILLYPEKSAYFASLIENVKILK
jgi:tetratricopeptide (TPR) repeat protein